MLFVLHPCMLFMVLVTEHLFMLAAVWTGPVNLDHVADTIQRQRSSSMNDFEIFHDSSTNIWHVVGAGIQRFVQMTNWQYVTMSLSF